MERVEVLAGLTKKIKSNQPKQENHSPFIITLMKKCIEYKIPYDLMCRLNYNDLLYMVVEYDIESINKYLNQKTSIERSKKGIEVVDATPDMTTAFFTG